MLRRGWIAAAALGLGGWLAGLNAQEVNWRAAARPAAGPASPPVLLDKPVPITRGLSPQAGESPKRYPPAYRKHQEAPDSPSQAIAIVAPPGAVIAASATAQASALPPPPQEELDPTLAGDLFAMDRRANKIRQANWKQPYPVDAPPTAIAPAPMPVAQPGAEPGLWETMSAGEWPASTGRFYARGEYLLWWMKNDHAPPLVTTGDPNNPNIPGALGEPDTVVLQDGGLDRGSFSGVRLTAGYWLDDCGGKAIEASWFALGQKSARFSASSSQFPLLARPFFDLNNQMESVEFVAFPGVAVGRVTVEAPSELWGADINLLCKACCGCDWRVNALAGFRYLNLRESLTITEDIQNLPLSLSPTNVDPFNGTRVQVVDSFATRNRFYGAQVGVDGRWQRGRFWLEGRATVALGSTQQEVAISGFQRFPPGTPNVSPLPGGLLALNSNIGTFSRDRFAVVPEARVGVGFALTQNIRATLGYNFLYWSSVVRPGDQIDRGLDITRIPNFENPPGTVPLATPRPAVLFKSTDFWAHGLTVGLEFTF